MNEQTTTDAAFITIIWESIKGIFIFIGGLFMWIVRKERKRIKDLEDKVEKMPKEIESTCRDTINRRDADIYEKFEELKKQGTDRETRIINAIDNLGNRIDRLYEKH